NKVFQETRSETIARHTEDMFRELRVTPQQWTAELVEEYHRLVPVHKRTVHFQTLDEQDLAKLGDADRIGRISKMLAANAQVMNRCRALYDENSLRFPADIEEAWKHCLREPYGEQLRNDLALRDGLLPAPIPNLAQVSDMQSVSQVTRHFSASLDAIAPTMDDFVIDANDLPNIPPAIEALRTLIGSATSLLARYEEQLQLAEASQP
ncbi:MAG TPA: hypothetical protein VFS13_00510, partial [Steroidobacteraceae bacterium]|nr:hypothetical protein [Steroidobacteraceae bacterium]